MSGTEPEFLPAGNRCSDPTREDHAGAALVAGIAASGPGTNDRAPAVATFGEQ